MKKTAFILSVILLASCTLTPDQRYQLTQKDIDARIEIAKIPIAEVDEAKNLKLYSQDRTMPDLPASDVDKYLDAFIKAGIIGLGAYSVHELSNGGDSTVNNYSVQGE